MWRFFYLFSVEHTVFLLLERCSSYSLDNKLRSIGLIEKVCTNLEGLDRFRPEDNIKQGPPHRQVAT